jgi:hypothetical protein
VEGDFHVRSLLTDDRPFCNLLEKGVVLVFVLECVVGLFFVLFFYEGCEALLGDAFLE